MTTADPQASDTNPATAIYTTVHYVMSEDTHLEMHHLFRAMDLVADLTEGLLTNEPLLLDTRDYSPLFRSLANYGQRLMADSPCVDSHGNLIKD